MRALHLFEKRKNPEQNPKQDALTELKKYAGQTDVFVSFTSDVMKDNPNKGKNETAPKIGLNPRNRFGTPTAIYTYPIDYVLSLDGKVPFAGREPYIWVVRSTANLLDLGSYDDDDFAKDVDKLKRLNLNIPGIKEIEHESKVKNPAGYIWYVLKVASEQYANIRNINPQTAWSVLLLHMGYEGASDLRDQGIIHSSEPTQAFFIKRSSLKVLDVLKNNIQKKKPKYSPKFLAGRPDLIFGELETGWMSMELIRAFAIVDENRPQWLHDFPKYLTQSGKEDEFIRKMILNFEDLKFLFDYMDEYQRLKIIQYILNNYFDNEEKLSYIVNEKLTPSEQEFFVNHEAGRYALARIIRRLSSESLVYYDEMLSHLFKDRLASSIPALDDMLIKSLGPKLKKMVEMNDEIYFIRMASGREKYDAKRMFNAFKPGELPTIRKLLILDEAVREEMVPEKDVIELLSSMSSIAYASGMTYLDPLYKKAHKIK